MRARLFLGVAVLALLAASAEAQQQYIVQVDNSLVGGIAARYGLQVLKTDVVGGLPVALLSSAQPLQPALLSALTLEPGVGSVETDQNLAVAEVAGASSPPASTAALADALAKAAPVAFYGSTVRLAYVSQAATTLIGNDAAHRSYTGTGTVAVIDTGVDPTHPALQNALVPGYDFTRELPGVPSEWLDLAPSPTATALAQSTVAVSKNTPAVLNQSTVAILDQSTVAILDSTQLPSAFGHGTMVAGLVHLVAPSAKIMPLKAFGSDGSSDMFNIVRAIYYAVDHGAQVINMSFSMPSYSPDFYAAIDYAVDRGIFCMAAAGNSGQAVIVYPAGYKGVFGVGSTSDADLRSAFSNYGPDVYTAAPGEGLITAYPGNNYAGVWGTSFSTALVSGAAALLESASPNLTVRQMADLLEDGQPIDPRMGVGPSRLHLMKMLAPGH